MKLLRIFALFVCFSCLIFASEVGRAFYNGKAKGHVGTLAYVDFAGDGTFFDTSLSLAYKSASFYGYKFYTSAWFNPRIYEFGRGFEDHKTWFEIPELGISFFNSQLNFGFDAGRFSYTSDWVDNYVQGLSFYHTYSPLISYEVTWINQSARIKNTEITGFRGNGNWIGGLLVSGDFKIPNTNVVLTPYAYSVADVFWVPGFKARTSFDFLSLNSSLEIYAHLLSYVAYSDYNFQGDGIVYWSDVTYKDHLRKYEVGGGIVATNYFGAPRLDIFGQNSIFENLDGVLAGKTTTLYVFGKIDLPYNIGVNSSFRLGISSDDLLYGFEVKANYFLTKNWEIGTDFLMLVGGNTRNNPKGDNYVVRTFLQYYF